MAGRLFYTVFQQRPLIWVRQSSTLTSHTGDSIADLPWLMNTSWTKPDIYPPHKKWTDTVHKYSVVPARCAVSCITLQTNTVNIPAVSYLCCQKSQPVGTAHSCCSYRPEWTNALQQWRKSTTQTLLILTRIPGAAHQEMLTSYQLWTTGILCLRCGMDSDGMRILPTFIGKYIAVVVSLIFISYLHFLSFSRKCENCEPLTVKSGQWKKVIFRFSPL